MLPSYNKEIISRGATVISLLLISLRIIHDHFSRPMSLLKDSTEEFNGDLIGITTSSSFKALGNALAPAVPQECAIALCLLFY